MSFPQVLRRYLGVALGLVSLVSAGVLRSRITDGVKIEYTEVRSDESRLFLAIFPHQDPSPESARQPPVSVPTADT